MDPMGYMESKNRNPKNCQEFDHHHKFMDFLINLGTYSSPMVSHSGRRSCKTRWWKLYVFFKDNVCLSEIGKVPLEDTP